MILAPAPPRGGPRRGGTRPRSHDRVLVVFLPDAAELAAYEGAKGRGDLAAADDVIERVGGTRPGPATRSILLIERVDGPQ